jgi:organic radical activating enzyme
LKELHIEIAIETSGTYDLIGSIDWYCFSPKKFKAPVDEAYSKASELKVIINHSSDFTWAEEHAAKVSSACKLFLQPEWSKQERFLPQIIEYVKNNPKWRISLQTHKFMNIP